MRLDLVHKTHLDLAFTEFAANVETLYFERFIPDALRVACKLRENDTPTSFCWTVPTYILHRSLAQASRAEVEACEEFGGPRDLSVTIDADGEAGAISVDLGSRPAVQRGAWRYEKLGVEIDPANVVPYGRRVHSIDRAHAMHGDALNTVWSTNYTQWYDDDARFRFRVRL